MKDRIERMQQMPIFGGIEDEALSFLLAPAPLVRKRRGEWFFREGNDADGMYVLERGSVSICKGWQGSLLVLRKLHVGDCFGEMALLDLSARSASVRAEHDCEALTLTQADLYRLFEHDAEAFALIQMNIAREMSRRLRVTDDLLFRARMGEVLAAPEQLTSPDAP